MFELSVRWLLVGLDASLKAVLLALLAAGVLRLLRIEDSNLRHRVWTGVLIGMLVLPVLTPIVPALQLPLPLVSESLLALNRIEPPIETPVQPVTEPADAGPVSSEAEPTKPIAEFDAQF